VQLMRTQQQVLEYMVAEQLAERAQLTANE
jgi:hypothetical protein